MRKTIVFIVIAVMTLSTLLPTFAETSIDTQTISEDNRKVIAEKDNLESKLSSITLKFVIREDKLKAIPDLKVYMNDKFIGTTNQYGKLTFTSLEVGQHDATIIFENGHKYTFGFVVYSNHRTSEIWISEDKLPSNNSNQTDLKIEIPEEDNLRNTKVTVEFHKSITTESREYIHELISDFEPILNNFLGTPIENQSYTLVYDPNRHLGFSQDKKISYLPNLPNVSMGMDSEFDMWFINEYIHKYLEGRDIPIYGTRGSENRSHLIRDFVCRYMDEQDIRSYGSIKSPEYYINIFHYLDSLGADILLNCGPTEMKDPFNELNFLWETMSYDRVNAFTIEYAKGLWMNLVYARYLESGKFDFFRKLQDAMYIETPQTDDEFYYIIDSIINTVNGRKASDWLKAASGFSGKIDNEVSLKVITVNGNFNNIKDKNNPDYIYPFLVERTPGKVLSEKINVFIYKNKQLIYETVFSTGFDMNGIKGLKIDTDDFESGLYQVVVTSEHKGEKYIDETNFVVNPYKYNDKIKNNNLVLSSNLDLDNGKVISVKYDESIPYETQDYIDNLIDDIDPIIQAFAGEPIMGGELTIQHDPNGYNSMSHNYKRLNIKSLPKSLNGEADSNFDSFFFIEYYHMYHRGRSFPIESARYSENISQMMKVVIGEYLRENDIRNVSVKPIDYYLNLFETLDPLGEGILLNNGINANGPYRIDRKMWEKDSDYQQMMNVFTLDYSLSVWLQLFVERYRISGEYDFVVRLQEELLKHPISTEIEAYKVIDKVIGGLIHGKKPSEWLKSTSLFSDLDNSEIYVGVLPVQGNIMNIKGTDNPTILYPFVVERDGLAQMLETNCRISIWDGNGNEVQSGNVQIDIGKSYETYSGLKVNRLEKGKYVARVEVTVMGKKYIATRDFIVD